MTTIEERAKRYGIESANLLCSDFSEEQRERQAEIYARVYANIATEQKAIDVELLKRVHKGVICKAIREKKEVAMKAYCKRCQDMGGGYPCSHKCYEYIEYAKTLEE